jgi:hypothetical protein
MLPDPIGKEHGQLEQHLPICTRPDHLRVTSNNPFEEDPECKWIKLDDIIEAEVKDTDLWD